MARKKATRRESGTPANQAARDEEYREMQPDDLAYVVAAYAWRDGLTANKIVRALGWPSDSRHLMRVKRALRRAHGRILKLAPPPDIRWQEKLHEAVDRIKAGKNVQFHVVNDLHGPTAGPVFAKAAEVVAEVIRDAVNRKPPPPPPSSEATDEKGNAKPDVVISNAGGRSVSDTVKALLRHPPVLDEEDRQADAWRKRLEFVAGNAAYLPDQFQLSASFLSVTMAEIYGASHEAMPAVQDWDAGKRHKKKLNDASVFVCGAGSNQTGLMPSYFERKGCPLPKEAVGDIAFNLLDRDGDLVNLPTQEGQEFLRQLNPSADLVTLSNIAANGRVVLVLDSDQPESKTQIGAAALRRHYATDVVLGTRLARTIVDELR